MGQQCSHWRWNICKSWRTLLAPEREKQEETIKVTVGSLYKGKALNYNSSGTWHLPDFFQPVKTPWVFPYLPVQFLLSAVRKALFSSLWL